MVCVCEVLVTPLLVFFRSNQTLGISRANRNKLEDFVISMALIATALSIWLLERAGLFKEMRARDATRSWFRGGSSFCTC